MSATTGSMIYQLLKKDSVILLFAFFAGLVATFSFLVDNNFEELWIGESRFYHNAFVLYFVLATSLGLLLGLRDEVTRTQEFLWHRPVGRGVIFAAKMVGAGICLLSWMLLPWAAEWVVHGWGNPNKGIADTGRLGSFLTVATIMLSSFAASYFAASWRGHWILRFTFGAAPSVWIFVAGFVAPVPGFHLQYTSTATFLLAQGGMTVVLLFAAWRNERAGLDPDQPVAADAMLFSGGLAALAIMALTGVGAAELQREGHSNTLHRYPHIAQAEDGEYFLRNYDPELRPDEWVLVRFDSNHQPAGKAPETAGPLQAWRPAAQANRGSGHLLPNPYHGSALREIARFRWQTRLYLRRAGGLAQLVHLTTRSRSVGEPWTLQLGKGPEKQPFSARANGVHSWKGVVLVRDEDEFWSFDLERKDQGFVRQPLPNGDTPVYVQDMPVSRGWQHLLPDSESEREVLLVRGNKAKYLWDGQKFVQTNANEVIKDPWRRPIIPAQVDDPGLFTFTATIQDEAGNEVFRHLYTPRTWTEQGYATLTFLANVIRLPILDLQSFLRSEPRATFQRSFFTNPLFAGHQRFWFLALCLSLAGGLSFLTAKRLHNLQVPRIRIRLWTIAVALGGLPFFLLCRFHETNRAWQKPNLLAPDDAPKMWIQPLATSRSA